MMFDKLMAHVKTVAQNSKDAYAEGRYEVDKAMMDALDELGLPYHADMKQIKKRYFELCREFHPDTAQEDMDNARFLRVKEAYELLRAAYKDRGEGAD